ncbi:hypothetical protein ACFCX4_00115 [Kitasatospora sp. NPDC056327]|uniref:hypothetical protein n=1 Tax=Kitasatospora sp. NPDC056327 TaxID=3345785 RepID=UPI0035E3032E
MTLPTPPQAAVLPVPDLDDLRFQLLVDAAKRSLPGRAPRWTDHNVSDPGITLIEACAERVDRLGYRANRLPARQRTALMRLMGVAPAPASPARVTLRFTLDGVRQEVVEIPAGTAVSSVGPQPVVYTTVVGVAIAAGELSGTAEAWHLEQVVHEPVGVSTGHPGQRFATSRRPWHGVTASSEPAVEVRVCVVGRCENWRQVPTFANTGEDDKDVRWDDTAGEMEFGPVVPYADRPRRHGAIPQKGAVVTATYAAGGGRRGNLPVGTELETLTSPATLSVTIDAVLRAGGDEESWQEALDRTYLGLVPLHRAVTTHDYERVLGEQVRGLARVRVTALCRRPDPDVPTALSVPARPANVDAACVDWDEHERWVGYWAGESCLRIPFDEQPYRFATVRSRAPEPCPADDSSPFGAAPDAVFRFRAGADSARLWFKGESCQWDGADARPITEEFPGLDAFFTADLDGFCATANADGSWEVFFVKDDRYCHRAYRFDPGARKLTPVDGRPAVVSTLAAGFPGLPYQVRRSPDTVAVTPDGTFYFLKGADTCPAIWRSEDAGLAVHLVPEPAGSPEEEFTPGDPEAVKEEAAGCVERLRLLGERLRLREAEYVPFGIEVEVQPWADTASTVTAAVTRRLHHWFHPTAGGRSGQGWPWGQAVYAGEVGIALEQLPEVRRTFGIDLTGGDGTRTQRVPVPDNALVRLEKVTVSVVNPED